MPAGTTAGMGSGTTAGMGSGTTAGSGMYEKFINCIQDNLHVGVLNIVQTNGKAWFFMLSKYVFFTIFFFSLHFSDVV